MLATLTPILSSLIILALFREVSSPDARILAAPESINATLNSTTFFHCTGTGRWLNWFVDDHRQDTPQALARGIKVVSPVDQKHGTINSTLTIPATMENDNITILCAFVGDNGIIAWSPAALLRVQNVLKKVSNLNIDRADDYNHILMWVPPFTDVHPDIFTYTVCDNVTSTCQNTSDTRYVFPTLCDTVEFTVSAWNPVGEGERESIVHEPPDDVRRPTIIISLESIVTFKSLSKPVVTLLFQVDGNCFNLLDIEFRGQYSGVTGFENMTPTVDGTGIAILIFSENITADDFYTVIIKDSGKSWISNETNLTTFDIQKENIWKGAEAIHVTCVFARGSEAKGCFIVIELVSDGQPHSASMEVEALRGELDNGELEGEASTSFTDLEAGTYNVMIFDVGVDGEYKRVHNELIVLLEDLPMPSSSASTITLSAQTSSMVSPTITAGITTGVAMTVVAIIVVGIIIGVCVRIKANQRAAKKAVDNQQQEVILRQNLCYEDSRALRVTRGPQPTDIAECPAYGIV